MKSFKNHYNRNRYSSVSLLKNSSFENLQINFNSLLYYNDFTQIQKASFIWTGGGIVFNTSGGFVLINSRFHFFITISYWQSMYSVTVKIVYTTIIVLKFRYLYHIFYVFFSIWCYN